MTQATYQKRVPDNLIAFCEEMGLLFGDAEGHLYVDLRAGREFNVFKKEYQVKYSINARQFNSIHSSIKGKIASRNDCLKRQISELKTRIHNIKKYILGRAKKLKRIALSCRVGAHGGAPLQCRGLKTHRFAKKNGVWYLFCWRLGNILNIPEV